MSTVPNTTQRKIDAELKKSSKALVVEALQDKDNGGQMMKGPQGVHPAENSRNQPHKKVMAIILQEAGNG